MYLFIYLSIILPPPPQKKRTLYLPIHLVLYLPMIYFEFVSFINPISYLFYIFHTPIQMNVQSLLDLKYSLSSPWTFSHLNSAEFIDFERLISNYPSHGTQVSNLATKIDNDDEHPPSLPLNFILTPLWCCYNVTD